MNPTFARRSAAAALAVTLLGVVPAASAVTASSAAPPEKLPTSAQFAAGTCAAVAEPVLAVAKLSAKYRGAKTIPAADRKALVSNQEELAESSKAADPALRQPLSDLVIAIGFVRLRYASRSYDPALLAAMDTARKDVQHACVR